MDPHVEELEAEVRNLQAQVGHGRHCHARSTGWLAHVAGFRSSCSSLTYLEMIQSRCRPKLAPSMPSKQDRYAEFPVPIRHADDERHQHLHPLDCLYIFVQAMERRYTALAEQQGTLAAEKEKLLSEKQALMEVIAVHLQACRLPGPHG